MMSWQHKNVLVMGATGFLGRHLVKHLVSLGAAIYNGDYINLCDIRDVNSLFSKLPRMDCVFHLAGHNGGIEFNRKYPADIFYRNTVMGLNLLRVCQEQQFKKVVSVVASCAYGEENCFEIRYMRGHDDPKWDGVMEEKYFLDDRPNPTVACHGYAKRNLQLASQFYRQQYGLNAVCVCPTTLYGPGDSLDPQRTKVLGGLIRRFVEAKRDRLPNVVCWGGGIAQREFLYVEDAARLIAQSAIVYNDSDLPLNLGTGQEHTIRDLAEIVRGLAGYEGQIHWDTTRPDGQLRKRLDLTRMKAFLPDFTPTPLQEGLANTIDWVRGQLCHG